MKLLEVNVGSNSALHSWCVHLATVSAFHYSRTFVPKARYTTALRIVKRDFNLHALEFCIEFPALWKLIADNIDDIVSQLVANKMLRPPKATSQDPRASEETLKVHDASGSLFIIDDALLHPFNGSVLDLALHMKDVAKVYHKLSLDLPRFLRHLISKCDLPAFPTIFNRSLVSLPDDFKPGKLRLTPPSLKLNASTCLVKRFNRVTKLVLAFATKPSTWIWGI